MNRLTPEQVKGRIKNAAQDNHADPRVLMRFYMMERFLERVANSKYRDNFIIIGKYLYCQLKTTDNLIQYDHEHSRNLAR